VTQSIFVYETYIRSTTEKLWQALTSTELLKRYWMGASIESDWEVGSPWSATSPDGIVFDSGEILESEPQRRLVMKWQNEWKPEFMAEGDSRCIYQIEPLGMAVKLTVTHSIERPDSKFIASVTPAWPMVMSNLKSLLETGGVTLVENPRHTH